MTACPHTEANSLEVVRILDDKASVEDTGKTLIDGSRAFLPGLDVSDAMQRSEK